MERLFIFIFGLMCLSNGIYSQGIYDFALNASSPVIAGQGYTSIANASHTDAISENPAALYTLKNRFISTHINMYSAFETDFLTVDLAYSPSKIGIRYTRADIQSIDRSIIQHDAVYLTGGTYNYAAQAVYLSKQLVMTDRFKLGVSMRWMSMSIESRILSGYSSSLGMLLQLSKHTILGIGLENIIQTPFRWNKEGLALHSLDRYTRIGLSSSFLKDALVFSVETNSKGIQDIHDIHLGIAYHISPISLYLGAVAKRLEKSVMFQISKK